MQSRKNTIDYAVPYLNAVAAHTDAGLWAEQAPAQQPIVAQPAPEHVNPVAAMAMNETMNGAQLQPQTSTAGTVETHLVQARRQVEEAHNEFTA
jgi:hypothetical protein